MSKEYREVPVEKLRGICDPEELQFETTQEVPALEVTVGQDRAVKAIEFGLNIKTQGFNIYVAGPVGTGRNSTVKAFLKKVAEKGKVPEDWCYLNNFSDPDKPIAVSLPPGKGRQLARDMEELMRDCEVEIPRAFESEDYEKHKSEITDQFQEKKKSALEKLQKMAAEQGFVIQTTAAGIVAVPVKDGEPLKMEEYEHLAEAEKEQIKERGEELQEEIGQVVASVRKMEKEIKAKIRELDNRIALFAIGHLIEDLNGKYMEYPKVRKYLEDVQADIVRNVEEFKSPPEETRPKIMGMEIPLKPPSFTKHKMSVNVLVDNSTTEGAPVVMEQNPTYYNLFGRIDYEPRLGAVSSDFSMIKSGAIHWANGGYLVLQARDVLTSYFSWDALKRTMRSGEAIIENIGDQFRTIPTPTLRPEPIPINVKVVLVGSPFIYGLLYSFEEDFRKLFKVKADFDIEIERNREHMEEYASFISARCKEATLKPFDRSGVAKVVEYGSWLVGDQEKLSTRFIDVADILSEANFWADKEGASWVNGSHVEKAIQEKGYRSNMVEEKIQELVRNGTVMIDADGEAVGQVNGLSIYQLGEYQFGKPSRITARTYVGKSGVVNIERETELSGNIHSKGVLILSGYLGGKYAHDKPLSLSASVCFEQLYEEVEGDSASSTELYALLSSLSGLPLKQAVAVTGSVNQRGEIQPIGGVTRKIEGFFDVCKAKGLTGEQGVLIPHQNVKNLMLKDEVIQAVRDGAFHIWPIESIDEGIEILTGIEAGERRKDGTYKKGTVNYLVERRLKEMAEQLREFEGGARERV